MVPSYLYWTTRGWCGRSVHASDESVCVSVSKVRLCVCCMLASIPDPSIPDPSIPDPSTPVLAGRMQIGLWLATTTLAAVLGMVLPEDGLCWAPAGKDGFPGIPGLDGRPGQKGDVGEPGKEEPGMCGVGGLGALSFLVEASWAVGAAQEMPDMHELLFLTNSPQGNQHRGQASRDPKGMQASRDLLASQETRATMACPAPPDSQASQDRWVSRGKPAISWSNHVLPSPPHGSPHHPWAGR